MKKHKLFPQGVVQAFCVLLFSGLVQAQEPETGSSEPALSRQTPAPLDDEIIVTGERSLNVLERQAGHLTLNFYELLNDAIDEKEFNINCQFEKRVGTQIQRRVCRTRYVESAQARQAGQMHQFLGSNDRANVTLGDGAVYDAKHDILMKQKQFRERVLQAVNEDPALNRAFWELLALKEEIESIREAD